MAAPRKRTTQPRSSAAPRVQLGSGSPATVGAADQADPWPPPPGISDEALAVWNAIFAEPQAHGFTAADAVILERYIRAFDAWQIAMSNIELEPLVVGSMGQQVANPLMGWAKSREAEMEKCERQLGIGLRNRTDLGIAVAQGRLTAAQLNAMTPAGGDDGGSAPKSAGQGGARKKAAGKATRQEAIEAQVLEEFEHA